MTQQNNKKPSDCPHRILWIVSGCTPQVVTETLYVLCVKQPSAFVPTEIYLITTAEDAEQHIYMSHDFFDRTLSRTNISIRKALGVLADAYLIKQKDIIRGQGVCIGVQPEEIAFINN